MTPAIACAVGAMLSFGLADIVYKRAISAGVLPHHLMLVQSWLFTSSVALFGLLTGTLTFSPGSLWGSLAGLFMWSGFHNFAHSLKSGSVSVNAPIFRLSFVITAALAIWLLHEPVTTGKTVGLILAVIAVWLLLAVPGAAGRTSRPSLGRVLIATGSVAIGNLLLKAGVRADATPAALVVMQGVVVVTLSTLVARITDGAIRPSAVALRYAPVAALLLAAGFALLAQSLVTGQASQVVPISQMGLAVSAVAGYLFLHETFSRRKAAGLAAALAALACFALG